MSAAPYIPTTQPMKGEEQETLIGILSMASWNTPGDRLRIANTILRAGFHRSIPRKVTKAQLWTYLIEAVLLAICAHAVYGTGQPFTWGILVALTTGSALTFIAGLIINAGIQKGFRA